MMDRNSSVEWVLGEDAGGLQLQAELGDRWMELPHGEGRQRGHILLPGEHVASSAFSIDRDHVVCVDALRGIPRVSDDGLVLNLRLKLSERCILLGSMAVTNDVTNDVPQRLVLSLGAYAGLKACVELECDAGPLGDPSGDWAALSVFAIAPEDRMQAARARAQSQWRLANEGAFFTEVYSRPQYRAPTAADASSVVLRQNDDAGVRARSRWVPPHLASLHERIKDVDPTRGQTPQNFASQLLEVVSGRSVIPFEARLGKLYASRGRLRVLSLCAGAARVEERLLRESGVGADLLLIDINEALLGQAAARMPAEVAVSTLSMTIAEAFERVDGAFDVVMFVSGLHHVPDLERTLAGIRGLLADEGEFWLIGESISRNGNRLWPEARRPAEALFRGLPERLRYNGNSGKTDAELPDIDCSTSSYEGVRSEEIVQVLRRDFMQVLEDERNCMLWRFVDAAYQANYDLDLAEDRDVLRLLAAHDHLLFATGARGCELDGVYRPKAA